MELCLMLCSSLRGRRVWGRMDTYVRMAESLLCSSETITTLFENGLYPNTKQKVLRKKKNGNGGNSFVSGKKKNEQRLFFFFLDVHVHGPQSPMCYSKA